MKIAFTDNYQDLSSDRGYQFKFLCERCGNGYLSSFKKSNLGTISSAARILGNFFDGGDRIANSTDEAQRMTASKAHDDAFTEAIEEIRPSFIECPRCTKWVCQDKCWNDEKGLCKECAPDLGVEMAAAQASRTVEEIHAHAEVATEDLPSKVDWKGKRVKASCPKCRTPLTKDLKFCPNCGENLYAAKKCAKCAADLGPGVKFCVECGEKVK